LLTTDGLFTCPKYTIRVSHNHQTVTIVPFGCIHRHSRLCNVEKWHETLEKMKSLPNAYFIGMGDYEDMVPARERIILRGANLYDTTEDSIYKMTDNCIKELAAELSWMKGRLIGLLGGNHYMLYPNGITSDQKLCELLGCQYLGCSSYIALLLSYHGRQAAYKIWAHHGKGASRTVGGSIQRIEQMKDAMVADCYCMGHDHKRSITPANDQLEIVDSSRQSEPYLRKKVRWLARTGSFLNSYEPGMPSYISDAAKSPVNQGCVALHLTYHRWRIKGESRVEIEAVGGYL